MGVNCKIVAIALCALVIGCAEAALWEFEGEEDICDLAVQEISAEDRATVADESPSRLHAVWISQECEIRAGPEFIIRKYTFFENGTFQLMRHHYAEESCSIATHTVTARGIIRILGSSLVTPGATEARYQLDTVHISPLNRQVAHKLGHRVNVSCGPQPRWRPYMAQPVYERAPERFGPAGSQTWQGPRYNSLHQGVSATGTGFKTRRVDCLSPLNIDFDELRLLRVQKKPMGFRSAPFGGNDKPRMELYLGALPPDEASKRSHRPTSLQPVALLRTDTIHNCPICGAIARGTENSPPLLHEVVALPALIGGSWVSPSCESHTGGVWVRRQMRVYAGDQLWTGRWDYHSDARCNNFMYAISAAGSYVQRARRHHRHEANSNGEDEKLMRPKRKVGQIFKSMLNMIQEHRKELDMIHLFERPLNNTKTEQGQGRKEVMRRRRAVDEVDYYRHLLQTAQPSMAESFAAMLRGNQRQEETTKRPLQSATPTGTTELDLHVAETVLIAGDLGLAQRCGAALDVVSQLDGKRNALTSWPSSCVPHTIDAPSTLGLRARISVDWYGQYTLLLGARDMTLWDAPLLNCGSTALKNPLLRQHLRRSVGLKFGILFNSATRAAGGVTVGIAVLCQLLLSYFAVAR